MTEMCAGRADKGARVLSLYASDVVALTCFRVFASVGNQRLYQGKQTKHVHPRGLTKSHAHRDTHTDKHKQWLQTVKATFCADDQPLDYHFMERGIRTTLAVSHFFSVISIALCFGAGHIVPPVGLPTLGPAQLPPQCCHNASWGLTTEIQPSGWQVTSSR